MKANRVVFALLCIFVMFSRPALPQSARPFKELIFAQVAAGGGYETWITVTNRGIAAYTGALNFYTGIDGNLWNPKVNGTDVSGGQMSLSIAAGATVTLKVTGTQSIQSGFASFTAAGVTQSNFIEGNLTYYVKSGETVSNSVGVMPATELFFSTIPFEEFSSVALALANRELSGKVANVTLTVYSDTNAVVGTKQISLGKNGHLPAFLYQQISGVNIHRGRVEIRSDVPIAGTALNFVQGQFSSLPLLPTMRVYDIVVLTSVSTASRAQMSLWSEGIYLKGYLTVSESFGVPISPLDPYLVTGQFSSGKLKLLLYGNGPTFNSQEVVEHITSDGPFTFEDQTVTGSWLLTFTSSKAVQTGSLTMTRRN